MNQRVRLIRADSLKYLKRMKTASVHAIVCDPPYNLSFMSRKWDTFGDKVSGSRKFQQWVTRWATECLRILKPGGYFLAFGGSRTYHRLASGVEDAGFEIRDQIMWVYGSGFPKSLDVSKAIDKSKKLQRIVIAPPPYKRGRARQSYSETRRVSYDYDVQPITAPASAEAKYWDGWGSALKPAHEPIVVARKPLEGTIVQNVLQHGTGGLNIDSCRIGVGQKVSSGGYNFDAWREGQGRTDRPPSHKQLKEGHTKGRFPSNLIYDGSEEVLAAFPAMLKSGSNNTKRRSSVDEAGNTGSAYGAENRPAGTAMIAYGDAGSAARFFYAAKTSRRERNTGMGEGNNNHPTVKNIALMRYLVRLVTPPNGIVLDPFMGSGTTGIAALLEGFRFVGVEREAEYTAIALQRIRAYKRYKVQTKAAKGSRKVTRVVVQHEGLFA